MDGIEIMRWIVAILAGLSATIPLVVKLVQFVTLATKEKNWDKLIDLVMKYMAEAEGMFDTGADKKDYVLRMIQASAETINYDVDMVAVSDLIDSLCDMSKVVNAPAKKSA